MRNRLSAAIFCVVVCWFAPCEATATEHAVAVTILKAQIANRSVLVKMLDGTEQIFRFTPQTPITSLAEAAISQGLHGGAGYQFVIHYTVKAREKVATAFDFVGREEWNTITGVPVNVDSAARTIVVTTEEGGEQSLLAGPKCVVESEVGAQTFQSWTQRKRATKEKLIVRYTEIKGRKVAHLLEVISATLP